MRTQDVEKVLASAEARRTLSLLYSGQEAEQARRYDALGREFVRRFGPQDGLVFASAPGRAEIAGNHTDHNHGRVLAAAVDLDTLAAAAPSGDSVVTLWSEGYDEAFRVDLSDLQARKEEINTTQALIRGVADGMARQGLAIGGFNACVTSSVFRGSGLSSSAAFEVMLCHVFDVLFGDGRMDAQLRARISQYAENVHFGKPSGLLDQMASSVGGLVTMDFEKPVARIEALSYDFAAEGYVPVVVAPGGDHGNLTDQYAAIPVEMKLVANALGAQVLRDVPRERFEDAIPTLRGKVPDRAILRALHFYDEDARIPAMVDALKRRDTMAFLEGIRGSGESSWKLLQNLYVPGADHQEMTLALALAQRLLGARGACRIHGGGFAGTILAFVPTALLTPFRRRMDEVFGAGASKQLAIRPVGPAAIVG